MPCLCDDPSQGGCLIHGGNPVRRQLKPEIIETLHQSQEDAAAGRFVTQEEIERKRLILPGDDDA